MTNDSDLPTVVVALPFAYQDGMDKYNGIMRYLRAAGRDWNLEIVREVQGIGSFLRDLTKPVAGVICGTSIRFEAGRRENFVPLECRTFCRRRRIPMVALDWPFESCKCRRLNRCSFLNINSGRIGTFAAQTVLKAGSYAAYGFVGKYPECAWSRARGAFFARTVRKAGRYAVRAFCGNPRADSAELAGWLRELKKPAAVFAANDSVADAVLRSCARNGLRVPDDLSVLGVDDDPVFCVHTRPTLSSIRPDFDEMGYLAAKELDRLMAGAAEGRRLVVDGRLSVTDRVSTAPCSPAGMMVRRADEIIRQCACQNVTANFIADKLKISRRLLDLRYRQFNGMSVREAMMRARVDQAKRLLAGSGHSIGTICQMCGYRTKSYLGKLFAACEGMTMCAYRARVNACAQAGERKDGKGR